MENYYNKINSQQLKSDISLGKLSTDSGQTTINNAINALDNIQRTENDKQYKDATLQEYYNKEAEKHKLKVEKTNALALTAAFNKDKEALNAKYTDLTDPINREEYKKNLQELYEKRNLAYTEKVNKDTGYMASAQTQEEFKKVYAEKLKNDTISKLSETFSNRSMLSPEKAWESVNNVYDNIIKTAKTPEDKLAIMNAKLAFEKTTNADDIHDNLELLKAKHTQQVIYNQQEENRVEKKLEKKYRETLTNVNNYMLNNFKNNTLTVGSIKEANDLIGKIKKDFSEGKLTTKDQLIEAVQRIKIDNTIPKQQKEQMLKHVKDTITAIKKEDTASLVSKIPGSIQRKVSTENDEYYFGSPEDYEQAKADGRKINKDLHDLLSVKNLKIRPHRLANKGLDILKDKNHNRYIKVRTDKENSISNFINNPRNKNLVNKLIKDNILTEVSTSDEYDEYEIHDIDKFRNILNEKYKGGALLTKDGYNRYNKQIQITKVTPSMSAIKINSKEFKDYINKYTPKSTDGEKIKNVIGTEVALKVLKPILNTSDSVIDLTSVKNTIKYIKNKYKLSDEWYNTQLNISKKLAREHKVAIGIASSLNVVGVQTEPLTINVGTDKKPQIVKMLKLKNTSGDPVETAEIVYKMVHNKNKFFSTINLNSIADKKFKKLLRNKDFAAILSNRLATKKLIYGKNGDLLFNFNAARKASIAKVIKDSLKEYKNLSSDYK